VLTAGVSALLLVALAVVPVEQTEAGWIDREHATATLSIAALPAPDFRCASTGGILVGQVGFVWTTPAVPYTGAVLQGYDFSYGLVGGSMKTESLPATATSASVPAAGLVLLSSYTVSLKARYNDWHTPVTSRTIGVLLGALSITIFNCA
jgi:hypothetical protein